MLRILAHAFWDGFTHQVPAYIGHVSRKQCIRMDKEMRAHLSEKQLDKTIMDSFPASDPPSTY